MQAHMRMAYQCNWRKAADAAIQEGPRAEQYGAKKLKRACTA